MIMFRKILAHFLYAFGAVSLAHAAVIDFTEASQHIGEEMTVSGKVSRVGTIPSGMTFVNFGADFAVVARPGIADAEILKGFEGKVVEVTGTIAFYKDSPQIVIKSMADIRLPGAAPSEEKPPEGKPMAEPAQPASAITTFEVPLDKKEINTAGNTSGGEPPSKASVAVAFPENMDPEKPHTILAVFPDFHSDADLEKLITPYAQIANAKGWIVIAARGSSLEFELPAAWHSVMFQAVFRHLETDYPKIAEWPIYLAGNADGAGRATLSIGAFMEADFDVRGCYLSSLKREEITKSVETFSPSKMKVKKLKVFVSLGKDDSMVAEADSILQAEAIREAGIKEVRHETHSGRTGVDAESLGKAIEWFETEE
jgi:hypothetical protein